MYKIGDYVVHNGHGVCTILDETFNQTMNKTFLKLETIHNKMSIMMPKDKSNEFLRPILIKDELIKEINNGINYSKNYNKDNKERKNEFQELITSNNVSDTIKLLRYLYQLSIDKKKEKKSLGSFDSQFLQQAERKLFNELAISANISKEEAHLYIINILKDSEEE